ncbi:MULTISPECIES: efflux RND transporter periplasmic adaptor subunit [unclassified Undibacterium]|uniref:efflux RND transporter periplasmic adaptor subunit n=1 Tax=unclassified Undibacterium TaxID=2630295 RepID=UPI002AC96131|nr:MULTISPECIES: efflux RND transporter periplasmic adaptor subunit [unclassified Undibacterium]MEB0139684.1 efflux RND transporter periplasmic adaptor subunit [Undibacterium sp. CCC2.1]MEB0172565.1 efflux RND transporter periplasmic adaptor subunit [Undibacterium sp. CCC1.1]MEB0176339.1 efflux RND transporter periplasmic adaptor subunit [Undibacterium sp. CCC3.4]MEB0215673.1 efflux RND transporter periplasmic adaptor subunit [Undibacterium sp. 5I2]WPX42951.1 efflux RND transporter periplasmic
MTRSTRAGIGLLIALLLLVAGSLFYYWRTPAASHARAGKEAAHAHAGEATAHAGDEHGAPARAPSQAEHAEEEVGKITMNAQTAQQNGVEFAAVGPIDLKTSLKLTGEVRLNQDRVVQIVPRLAGIVESVHVNAGDQVKAGQLLAVVSSQALADQRSELLAAQKRYALAERSFEREKKLWDEKISAEQDFLAARISLQELEIGLRNAEQKLAVIGAGLPRNEQHLARHEVRAPISGTITEKQIAVGQSLKEDSAVFTLADLATVWVELTIPAADLDQIRPGQSAEVSAQSSATSATGKLSFLSPVAGQQTRQALARLVLPNTERRWHPGLTVQVALASGQSKVPLAIKNEAIQQIENQPQVFVRQGDYIVARVLKAGRSDGQWTEVLGGLQAGESYVTKNSFLIKAELGKASAAHEH